MTSNEQSHAPRATRGFVLALLGLSSFLLSSLGAWYFAATYEPNGNFLSPWAEVVLILLMGWILGGVVSLASLALNVESWTVPVRKITLVGTVLSSVGVAIALVGGLFVVWSSL